jgi:hypothetical protein
MNITIEEYDVLKSRLIEIVKILHGYIKKLEPKQINEFGMLHQFDLVASCSLTDYNKSLHKTASIKKI